MKLLYEIVLPKFPTHVKLSDKRRTKYKLLESGEKVIANPKSFGTPLYKKINTQDLYSGNLNHYSRSSIVSFMHNFIMDHLKKLNLPQITQYPIVIRGEIHTVRHHGEVKIRNGKLELKCPKNYKCNWDVQNLWLWAKVFDDCLKEDGGMGIIKDDDADLVSGSGEMRRIWITDFEERKLVFKIYHDDTNV